LLYREKLPAMSLIGRNVIVVDDGLATGASMIAALKWLRSKKIKKLIAAVPVSSLDGADKVRELADEFISLINPENMWAVGYWYDDFSQVSDSEVIKYLEQRHESIDRMRVVRKWNRSPPLASCLRRPYLLQKSLHVVRQYQRRNSA
jgi:predicted phosphoribosyltransferase